MIEEASDEDARMSEEDPWWGASSKAEKNKMTER